MATKDQSLSVDALNERQMCTNIMAFYACAYATRGQAPL